ncbi:legumain precursor [Silurus asotus]|uniref:legumain n=1 Tax=Silurus asotus TaxID=30991 RepID=A0AAD5F814_SILAS|nr:legumain precursor [Silurus asotus]
MDVASSGKQWILLAAGSKGWEDYDVQANVCHAYQVAHRSGVPDQQIVVMMYDDVAYSQQNPFPGNIINAPNGPNVYPGVLKDYTGEEVSAENFLAVLCGDSAAVKKTGRKKVIESGENDSIFIYLSDHGNKGIFHFPNSTLYAHDLINTVKTMSKNRKFSKMVIYLESCHSGSMLNHLSESNVYAVSSCRPDEYTYACFFDKERNTFLSDLFSINWLQHMDTVKLTMTSFGEQFSYLEKKVSKDAKKVGVAETPCNYGDKSITKLMLSEFFGGSPGSVSETYTSQLVHIEASDVVDITEVPLILQENKVKNEQDPEKRQALQKQYEDLINKRKTMDEALQKIAERTNALQALTRKHEVTRTYELKVVAEHFKKNIFNWEKEPCQSSPKDLYFCFIRSEFGTGIKSQTQLGFNWSSCS